MTVAWPLTARSTSLEWLGQKFTDAASGGVVLTGPAGVGKTRLGEEVLVLSGERPAARAVGHTSTQSIPLGALAHLLPADLVRDVGLGDDDRAALFHQARAAIAERAGLDRLLLMIDDVDQLDDTSLALLLPLTVQHTVFLVATIRVGRTMPGVIAALVKDGHLAVHEVAPLAHDDIVTLLHRVLDGPVESASGERLSELSEGNLQVLQEIVQVARQRGSLRLEAGAWRLTEVPVPRALEELVASRVGGLDAKQRRALDLLAVAGSLDLDGLVELSSASLVADLESQQLLRLTADENSSSAVATLSHPVYGEVLRAELGVLGERSIKRALADMLDTRGAHSPEARARLAAWRLDSGGDVDAGVLLAAGRLALIGRDAAGASRFARAARERGATHDAARIAVEAALLASDPATAEAEVARVWDDTALADGHRAHLAARITNSRFAQGDLDGALAMIEDAARRVADPRAVASINAQHANLLATTARPVDALRVLDGVSTSGADDPRPLAQACSARSIACSAIGRFDDALAAARDGFAAQARLPEWLARRGMATHLVNEAHALSYCGRFVEAHEIVTPALAAAADAGALAAQVWFHIVLGETWRDRGYGARALEHFQHAVALAEPAHQQASLVWSWVGVAQGHLLRGDGDEAAVALAHADEVGDSPVGTSAATRERTRAWLTACRGDLPAARTHVAAIADAMQSDGVIVFEAVLRHDLVRFGDAAAAVGRLAELAAVIEGPWIRVMADHALAVASHDAALLQLAVDQFEAIDSIVFGAEAALELAELHRQAGQPRPAAAAERRAQRLIERSGGARTPGLTRGTAAVPLTAREREVALLAATGLSSSDIAARLVLSIRTVDTHLARIYRKLGIAGRGDLPDALTTTPSPA